MKAQEKYPSVQQRNQSLQVILNNLDFSLIASGFRDIVQTENRAISSLDSATICN